MKAISSEYADREFVFVQSKDCDLTKLDDTINMVDHHNPDAILHIAAISGGVELHKDHPAMMLRDNVFMNLNILEAARAHGTKKTVMTLSTGMYPENAPNPITEDSIHEGFPHPSVYSYSFAKRMVEPAIRAYRSEYGMKVIGLIPNGIIGEGGIFNRDVSLMWAALVRRFYENMNTSDKLVVWGDGTPVREHTYSHDIAKAYMWCLDNYDELQVLNVGSIEEHSVKEIAEMIADVLGMDKGRIQFDTSKPSGAPRKSTDNTRFVKLSGFEYTPFRVGLEKTIGWFRENYHKPGQVRL
jgi:GDP-L-fucose synthase